MKAFVVEHYGRDGVRAADVPEPEVGDGDVLVKVSAASVNPLDRMVRDGEFKRLPEVPDPVRARPRRRGRGDQGRRRGT
jgi:NADPH:quinone reductase-like Zn-dependent oxidoreductase